MDNTQRKKLILDVVESNDIASIHDALKLVGAEISSLEAIPFGSRNEVIRICEDLADGVISSQESLERFKKFISSIPDL